MNIDARNPIIHKLIKDFLLKDIEHALCEFHKYSSCAMSARKLNVMRTYKVRDSARRGTDCETMKERPCSGCGAGFDHAASRKKRKTMLNVVKDDTRLSEGGRCCDTCGNDFCNICVSEISSTQLISFICNDCQSLSLSLRPMRKTYWM